VDLTPVIGSYKVYRALRRDPQQFETAQLAEGGYAVVWPDLNLDMSADTIETVAEESMTPVEFASFLRRNSLTQESAAALLGRSRRQINYYLSTGPVPRIVALACYGYEALLTRHHRSAA
jgi:uncharacterized protein DUF2442